MAIHINEVLPVLDTILTQQHAISERLQKLIETFKRAPEPIAPTLRTMLKPLDDSMTEMHSTLLPISPDSPESLTGS